MSYSNTAVSGGKKFPVLKMLHTSIIAGAGVSVSRSLQITIECNELFCV
jgi:hypothetical protein